MRQRLVIENGKSKWVPHEELVVAKPKELNAQGEDLTIDGYIGKYGGIESNIDGKVYTSKMSYMDHIKANGCHIKDY